MAIQNQQNHNPYDLGDDALRGNDFQEVDEDFKETGIIILSQNQYLTQVT